MSDNVPKKSLGQHWLKDADTLEAIADCAEVNEQDIILEIGPGQGTLTQVLMKRAKKVVAVEYDEALYRQLRAVYSVMPGYGEKLELVQADILGFDLNSLPAGYKVVANIPYYLTSNLLRVLCEAPNHFSQAALLVQKEVAQRVAAKPGDMSMLSVSVQFYASPLLGPIVEAAKFTPPPKVDSQVLMLQYHGPLYKDVDPKQFFRLVRAGFSERRKKLRSSLSGGLQIGKDEATQLIESAGLNPNVRAQELSLDDWQSLYTAQKTS